MELLEQALCSQFIIWDIDIGNEEQGTNDPHF